MNKRIYLLMLALVAVFSVQAATITYVLKTHVDGRTITGSATVPTGDPLLEAADGSAVYMPQALWRAFCTYSFYTDEALTQEITEAPASNTTVYVDYEFIPPFDIVEEGETPVAYLLRAYDANTSPNNYIIYWKNTEKTLRGWKSIRPKSGTNNPMQYDHNDEWLFYGDAYSLNIKINDDVHYGNNGYLNWSTTYRSWTNNVVVLGAKKTVGWQLCVNTASNSKIGHGTSCLVVPNDGSSNAGQVMNLENLDYVLNTISLDASEFAWDSKNQLVPAVGENDRNYNLYKRQLWWHAILASPADQDPGITNIYRVCYVILKAYDNYNQRGDDINVTKPQDTPKTVQSLFPESKKLEGYSYKFYKVFNDGTKPDKPRGCEEEWGATETMPTGVNTIVYVVESNDNVMEFVTDHWITLVLPYDVDDLSFFTPDIDPTATTGTTSDGAPIRVLEYKSLDANETGTRFTLNFERVYSMEAHKPYLFKADRMLEGQTFPLSLDNIDYSQEADELAGKISLTSSAYPTTAVSMVGTYLGYQLPVATDNELYLYFGYNPKYDPTSPNYVAGTDKLPYNFYAVTKNPVTVGSYHAFFKAAPIPSGAKALIVNATGGINEFVTAIDGIPVEQMFGGETQMYNINGQRVSQNDNLPRGIYIANGKKMIVK